MPKIKIPPPLYGVAAAGLIVALYFWLPLYVVKFPGQNGLAISAIALGILIELTALNQFRKHRTTPNPLAPERTSTLVTNGIYRFSRNPMYVGLALILTGICLRLGHISGWVIIPVFIATINQMQIKPEERALQVNFGADFENYKSRVRRWL